MKIAIIGSGIAGLTSAWLLHRHPQFQVTLLERGNRVGMDSHCQRIGDGNRTWIADVPSRMFNAQQWPELTGLYDKLDVACAAVDPSQSFSTVSPRGDAETYLRLDAANRPRLSPTQWFRPGNRTLAREAKRLRQQGRKDLADAKGDSETLREYLNRHRFRADFVTKFLYPTLSSTICTCSYPSLDRYPSEVILQALSKISDGAPLLRVKAGTEIVVKKLTAGLADIRLSSAVRSIEPVTDGVEIAIDGQPTERFDHVIVATQANTAARLLTGVADDERDILASVDYEDVEVVVHRDVNLMPRRLANWSTFNMLTDADQTAAACTVWMNRFHHDWEASDNVFQTITPNHTGSFSAVVNPDHLIATTKLQRPVIDHDFAVALAALTKLQHLPNRRIWYAGSWLTTGIPLLESGVVSAKQCTSAIVQASRVQR